MTIRALLVTIGFTVAILLVAWTGVLTPEPPITRADPGIVFEQAQEALGAVVATLVTFAVGLLAGIVFLISDKLKKKFSVSIEMQVSAAASGLASIFSIYIGYMCLVRVAQVALREASFSGITLWIANQALFVLGATVAFLYLLVVAAKE